MLGSSSEAPTARRLAAAVVGLIHAERIRSSMDKNQLIALVFAVLMVSSMVAWGATAIF
ncbi:hypothetical protein [Natrinema versiforme]|uniref:hypothetical protein n=1 Tax=Natrinema versiforme TaxID=88724 RepID=UPI00158610E3|nr:hypothetical protein [Natrinema versiforme]